MKIAILLFGLAGSPAWGWWCEGHEVVALVASRHLSPRASEAALKLLADNPTDVPPFCTASPSNPLAVASTWADDVKNTEMTAFWHFLDIPRGLRKGDPETYCEPIGPSHNGAQRPGCILSALRYAVNVIHSKDEPAAEKAKALRYLIHFVGDLHQPLHTTSNNDRGGNCTPVQFFDDPKITNLHAIWDGPIVNRDMSFRHENLAEFAVALDTRFSGEFRNWTRGAPQFDKWAWEGHLIADNEVYEDLTPEPPVEKIDPKADCKVVSDQFGALHIRVGADYMKEAGPIVEKQLAKAGFRLAAIMNELFE